MKNRGVETKLESTYAFGVSVVTVTAPLRRTVLRNSFWEAIP